MVRNGSLNKLSGDDECYGSIGRGNQIGEMVNVFKLIYNVITWSRGTMGKCM